MVSDGQRSLGGKVALVTGASRGIGRGIALELAAAGATVYITGRQPSASAVNDANLPSLEQTAKDIESSGGDVRFVYCDHSNLDDTKRLFEQIDKENNGQLDILVNNAYAGVNAIIENFGRPFFECEPEIWDVVNNVGLRSYYFCTVYAARLMTRQRGSGLVVNISSAGGLKYLFNVAYGVGKAAVDRMSADTAFELRKYGVAVVSLWPGPVETEIVRDTINKPSDGNNSGMSQIFQERESPEFVGRAVVALAADTPADVLKHKSGRILTTADLADEYHFVDPSGMKPMNMRSLSKVLLLLGYSKLASYVPDFIKIPKFFLNFATNKF